MAMPRNSLRGFLTHARGVLRNAIDSGQKITFVIGNESADLDSMTSSVLYAYIRSMAPPRNAFTPIYVPITNIPSSDVQLRPEFLALLRHASIEPRHLLTLDDLPDLSVIKSRLLPENTRWILVDHNALQGQLGKIYADRVGGVIDHHDDEGKVPKDTGDEPRIIEKSGSCSSLVTEYCQQTWDSLSDSATSSSAAHAGGDCRSDDGAAVKIWDAEAAKFGLASILIDTSNLQSKDKTTEHDKKAVKYLEAKIMTCPEFADSFSRSKFYEEIDSARKDIGGLGLQDILRKDYKQWDERQKLGISAVVKPIKFLQEKAAGEAEAQSLDQAFVDALHRFATERELDLYALMTTSTSPEGQFQRELLVWAFGEAAIVAAKQFVTNARKELGLEGWSASSGDDSLGHDGNRYWRKVWWQRNVQHSRKRVAPLLREAMT